MKKRVLFIAYGGGHITMIAPVARAMMQRDDVDVQVVALTTGGVYCQRVGLPYKGFKDYVDARDAAALAEGERMAQTMHTDSVGIARDESVAYLGLSYYDLVVRHGETEAARLWQEKQRHAFYPLSFMERIIAHEKPDIVVTTNSPRAEAAAVTAAKKLGIPTMSLVDLFGFKDFHVLDADYLCVLSEITKENMRIEQSVSTPVDNIFVTGNPAFDETLEYSDPPDAQWRKAHYPTIADGKPIVLWADAPGFFSPGSHELYIRSNDEILFDLDVIANAAEANNAALLIRPHPSQDTQLFTDWIARRGGDIHFAGHVPLYPLLNCIDAAVMYNSTVAIHTLLAKRFLVQLQYIEGRNDIPLGEWGLAWLVRRPEDVSGALYAALHDDAQRAEKRRLVEQTLPQHAATPLIVSRIMELLAR